MRERADHKHWQRLALKARSAVTYEDLIPSPCASVCRLLPDETCEGCLRTVDEIRAWSMASDADKRAVWRLIQNRIAVKLAAP